MIVGNKIREIRNERGISLDALGRLTDLSSGYLGRLERNEDGHKNPTLETLEKLATALGVRVTDFIDDTDAA